MSERFSIECRQEPGVSHVIPRGELDMATVPALERVLALEQGRPGSLVLLDLRRLTFLDSTGIHCLVRAEQRARDHGSRLTIVRGPRTVQMTLEIAGLADALPIVDEPPVGPAA